MEIIDDKLPLMMKIMTKLGQVKFQWIGGLPERRYFPSMNQLYNEIGGVSGRKIKLIDELKEHGVIKADANGVYYDTDQASKLIKKSSKLVKFLENNDVYIR